MWKHKKDDMGVQQILAFSMDKDALLHQFDMLWFQCNHCGEIWYEVDDMKRDCYWEGDDVEA